MPYSDVNIFVTCQWFLFVGWFVFKYQTHHSSQKTPIIHIGWMSLSTYMWPPALKYKKKTKTSGSTLNI